MRLLADGRDHTTDFNIFGYLSLCAGGVLCLVYLIVLPMIEWQAWGEKTLVGICLFCSLPLLAMLTMIAVSTNYGVLFKRPLKVYDNGISLQPRGTFGKLVFVPFHEIKRLDLFTTHSISWNWNRGCEIVRLSGREITSLEHFSGRAGFVELMDKIRPNLVKLGFVETESRDDGWRTFFRFERGNR